jgi:hypothetical protein
MIPANELTPEKIKTRPKAESPVQITDITLRDGHQSLLATRMRTEDMELVADQVEKCGFWAVEVWGGATFDVPHRFLGEDPWERPRVLKKLMPKTKFMMLLRGQNLVGYRNYADDVARAFCHQAAEAGIDIFRVFDAVNDERNHEMAYKAIKETGKHIQGAICYSLTQPRLGGTLYNIEYYVKKALLLQEMGADSICIKDQAGLISPYNASMIGEGPEGSLRVPLELHTHYTSRQAAMPTSKPSRRRRHRRHFPGTRPPDIAPRHRAAGGDLYGTERDTGLDIGSRKCDQMLRQIAPKYDFVDTLQAGGHRPRCCRTRSRRHDVQLHRPAQGGRRPRPAARATEETVIRELGYPPVTPPARSSAYRQQNVLAGPYR